MKTLKDKIVALMRKNIKSAEFYGMTGFGVVTDQILEVVEEDKTEKRVIEHKILIEIIGARVIVSKYIPDNTIVANIKTIHQLHLGKKN